MRQQVTRTECYCSFNQRSIFLSERYTSLSMTRAWFSDVACMQKEPDDQASGIMEVGPECLTPSWEKGGFMERSAFSFSAMLGWWQQASSSSECLHLQVSPENQRNCNLHGVCQGGEERVFITTHTTDLQWFCTHTPQRNLKSTHRTSDRCFIYFNDPNIL